MSMIKSQSKKDISLVFKTHTKETFVDKYKDNKSEDTKLVPSYVFDTFVEGKSNHVALAASKQVASNPRGLQPTFHLWWCWSWKNTPYACGWQ